VLLQYDIEDPYLYVPNHLWAHKNHGLIISALEIFHRNGQCPIVISTGQTQDTRNPGHFPFLKGFVANKGLEDRFRFLGLVPFEHVAVLMRESIALINPSRFEGWSTTVEEAKSLGKQILLSDIAVHKEQAPPHGAYFDCDAPEDLAELMLQTLDSYDAQMDKVNMTEAAICLQERMKEYAMAYEEIMLEIVHSGN
jgi:glycosyltransferase involved in cell wall biosynthesis